VPDQPIRADPADARTLLSKLRPGHAHLFVLAAVAHLLEPLGIGSRAAIRNNPKGPSLAQPPAQCQQSFGVGLSGRVEFFRLLFYASFLLFASP